MAGITLVQAEAQLAKYLAAEEAVLSGQSYRLNVGGNERELKRANLAEIQSGIATWDARVKQLERYSSGRGIPVNRVGYLD